MYSLDVFFPLVVIKAKSSKKSQNWPNHESPCFHLRGRNLIWCRWLTEATTFTYLIFILFSTTKQIHSPFYLLYVVCTYKQQWFKRYWRYHWNVSVEYGKNKYESWHKSGYVQLVDLFIYSET